MTGNSPSKHWRAERDNEDIVWLHLDRADASVNALSVDVIAELNTELTALSENFPRGLVILSDKKNGFIAGADVKGFVDMKDENEAAEFMRGCHTVLDRLESFTFPTVSLIHGFCLGGGLELALACDIRIAAADAIFSMREVPLGSLPGSGGLQRLPLVVGFGVAKDWILRGTDVPAEEAYRRGLVTELVPRERLDETAQGIASQLAAQSATALWLAKVALSPNPPADHGIVAAFQALAVSACHGDPSYHRKTERYTAPRTAR